jgi:HEAT repeat protein
LPKQDWPLVQVAAVDVLADMRDPSAVEPMKQLLANPDLNESVRERIQTVLQKF